MKDLIFILSNGASSLTLTHSPDGWDDTLVRYERSTKYWGLFRSFTVQLKFVKEGATYLRNEFYTNGVSALVTCQIKRLNKITLEYYTAYTAEVDFATFKDEDHTVSVNLVEGGLSKLIKNKAGTEYVISEEEWDGSFQFGTYVYNDVVYWQLINVFSMLVEKITDGEFGVKSNFLSSKENVFVIAKYFDTTSFDSFVKTSLDDFFKSINAAFCLGMGIEIIEGVETLVIEPVEYFFDTENITHFSSINDFRLSVLDDLHFNSIKIGFPEQTYGDDTEYSGGEKEANTYSIFTTPILNITKEIDLTSKYRGDITGILEFSEKNEPVQIEDNFLITLMVHPTIPGKFYFHKGLIRKKDSIFEYDFYNVELSPRRLLNNHKEFIESCLNCQGSDVIFTAGGNKQHLNETKGLDWIEEYTGFTLAAPSIFLPYAFEITVPLAPGDFNSIVGGESLGVITFDYQGNTYKGYILDIKVKLAGRGEVEFKLLASYDNDLTTLIR